MTRDATGLRLRKARMDKGLSQKQLAQHLGISPSYLNMIERGTRSIAGKLLAQFAAALDQDQASLSGQADVQAVSDLTALVASSTDLLSPQRRSLAEDSIPILTSEHREWVQIILSLKQQSEAVKSLSRRLQLQSSFDDQLAEIGHQILQHLTTVRSSAAILSAPNTLNARDRERFGQIVERESETLEAVSRTFFERLEQLGKDQGPVTLRRDLDNILHMNQNHFPSLELGAATLAAGCPIDTFADALEIARQNLTAEITELVGKSVSDPSNTGLIHAMERYLEQYAAAAMCMPYEAILNTAQQTGYDVDFLAKTFNVSFEQAAHRLTTLRQPGNEGIGFALMKVDAAGNVLKAYSLPSFFVPNTGATCPKWPIFEGVTGSSNTLANRIEHDTQGEFLAISKRLNTTPQHFKMESRSTRFMLVCPWSDAERTVYAQPAANNIIRAGTSCSICQFPNCSSRLRHSLFQ